MQTQTTHVPGTIIGLHPATPLTLREAQQACIANNESDPDCDYRAECRVGAWYVVVYDRETDTQLGIL